MGKEGGILPNTSYAVKAQLAEGLTHLEINHGCPGRVCYMCNYNSPKTPLGEPGPAMDFKTIQEIHALPSPNGPFSRFIYYHLVGEPMGYWSRDTVGRDYTLAEVVYDALEQQIIPCAMTHGVLPGDSLGIETASRLTALFERLPQLRGMFAFGFSIDTYGFVGMSRSEYEQIVRWNLALFDKLKPRITGYFNPNDPEGMGGRAALTELLDRVLPSKYRGNGNIDELPIFSLGRAAKINPPPVPWKGDYTKGKGYVIQNTGTIQLNLRGLASDFIPQGSIYETVSGLDPVL